MISPKYLTCALAIAASAAYAQMPPNMPMSKSPSAAAQAPALAEGIVQAVDASKGVVTLKHGEIVNMQMPAMTMAFSVADRKMLGSVKAGDKVRFRVEMMKNAPTVTRLEPAR
ncbi:copper-binding protein [Piscinibacter koreensis]|uniref:Copper-binding protein n=1 Tax=Piscinibacter koreensis TaxID=2742824 RepID=A0A7Y6NT75_9BURK|nr:copper-binding protein [Schlegelella koreensis]NUZ08907.1 copper-binding protein [Schlegelella koreensis]